MNDDNGLVIELSRADIDTVQLLLGQGAREGRTVKVWIDPLDEAVKFKIGNQSWSPPMGQVAQW